MTNDEWWVAVRKAAEHRQKIRNGKIVLDNEDAARTAYGSQADTGKPVAEGRRNEHDTRGR